MANLPDAERTIAEMLSGKAPALAETVARLRKLARAIDPAVRETVNPWGIPTFDVDGPLAYFQAGKYHVTFGFLRATALPDPAKLLEGTGKNLRHVKLKTPGDVDRPALAELLRAAIALNRMSPVSVMGGTRKPAKKAG